MINMGVVLAALVLLLLILLWVLIYRSQAALRAELEQRLRRIESRLDELDQSPPGTAEMPSRGAAELPAAEPQPAPAAVSAPAREAEPTPAAAWSPSDSASVSDLEFRLGGSWLNKIGVGVLVIGLSLMIGYTFQYLGPAGKIALGYLLSLLIFWAGRGIARRPGYSLYGKGLIGGGWALSYFTTYALHFVETVRLIESEGVALVLLGLHVAAMIAYSLHFVSQIATGLAFLLGFATVAISPIVLFDLSAILLLAVSLMAICWRFGWLYLAALGAVATYGSHFSWAVTAVRPDGLESLGTAMLLLIFYWFLFSVPNLKEKFQRFPLRLQALNLANSGSGLAVLAFQSQVGEILFESFLLAGLLHLLLAGWLWSAERRISSQLFATFGFLSLALAVPLKWTGHWRFLLWLLEAQAVFLTGFFLQSWFLRLLGSLALWILGLELILLLSPDPAQVAVEGVWLYSKTVVFVVAALLLHLNARRVYPRIRSEIGWEESLLVIGLSYLASALLVAVVVFETSITTRAVGWLVLGQALWEWGRWSRDQHLRIQGLAVLAIASAGVLGANLALEDWVWYSPAWTLGPFIAVGYSISWRSLRRSTGDWTVWETRSGLMAGSAACLFLLLLLWKELPAAWVAPGWGVVALLFLLLGLKFGPAPQLGGSVFLLAAAGRAFWILLSWVQPVGWPAHLLTSAILLAANLIVLPPSRGAGELPARWNAHLGAYSGAALLALLIYFEADSNLWTILWGLEGLGLFAIGFFSRQRKVRLLGLGLLFYCILKVFAYDLRGLDTLARIFSFIILGLILLLVSFLYTRFQAALKKYL